MTIYSFCSAYGINRNISQNWHNLNILRLVYFRLSV